MKKFKLLFLMMFAISLTTPVQAQESKKTFTEFLNNRTYEWDCQELYQNLQGLKYYLRYFNPPRLNNRFKVKAGFTDVSSKLAILNMESQSTILEKNGDEERLYSVQIITKGNEEYDVVSTFAEYTMSVNFAADFASGEWVEQHIIIRGFHGQFIGNCWSKNLASSDQ